MYKFLFFLGVSLAKTETHQSQPTSKTLISDGITKLIYTFSTESRLDSDDNSVNYLIGELKLEKLNTYWFVD